MLQWSQVACAISFDFYSFFIITAQTTQGQIVVNARYVRLEAPSSGDAHLQISYLAVMSGGANVAANKPCTSSSGSCSVALQGTPGQRNHDGSLFHSDNSNGDWFQVDLGAEYPIDYVTYYNRLVCCCCTRTSTCLHYVLLSSELLPNAHARRFA